MGVTVPLMDDVGSLDFQGNKRVLLDNDNGNYLPRNPMQMNPIASLHKQERKESFAHGFQSSHPQHQQSGSSNNSSSSNSGKNRAEKARVPPRAGSASRYKSSQVEDLQGGRGGMSRRYRKPFHDDRQSSAASLVCTYITQYHAAYYVFVLHNKHRKN